MNAGDVITFDAKKNFTFVKTLGAGGTGDTHLFKDETTDMLFAFKKYVPKDARFVDEHYSRFVDEIKYCLISHIQILCAFIIIICIHKQRRVSFKWNMWMEFV